jgi:predicted ATP-dependent endonuclease of OLD family
MRIQRLEVSNFRSIRSAAVTLGPCTALVGENNAGKSAFLAAIELFFASSPRVRATDYHHGSTDQAISITLHFGDLTPSEAKEFGSNLTDGVLVVTRQFMWESPDSGRYVVTARANPDFSECRNEQGKSQKRVLYKGLQLKYPELPAVASADEVEAQLTAWEQANPDALQVEHLSSFKGWTNVAAGKLKQTTSYVLIRAVQDVSEDLQSSKSSPVRALIDTLARQTIENSTQFKAFIADVNQQMSVLTDPKSVPALAQISTGLSEILAEYYRDSQVVATWEPITQIQPPFPTATIAVKDHGFEAPLDGVGHGLQRAIVLTVLRYMAEQNVVLPGEATQFDEPQSDFIIAIEEPEIYQHPTKQRLFSRLLRQITEGFNAKSGIRFQTVFVTHSPLLVSIQECDSIRMVRRTKAQKGQASSVNVSEISLERCAKLSGEVAGIDPAKIWSAEQYAAKLHTFGPELAEGFFAKCVVLVEGVGDQSVIDAWYRLRKRDPQAEGIVIVCVGGKNNLDKPITIFQELGVPCFWVFDNDRSKCKKKGEEQNTIRVNRILQKLGGIADPDLLDWPSGCRERFASWDMDLESYVQGRAQGSFGPAAEVHASEFNIEVDLALKFPACARRMLGGFSSAAIEFPELDEIIVAVDSMLNS